LASPEYSYVTYLGGERDELNAVTHLDDVGYLVALATVSSGLETTPGCIAPEFTSGPDFNYPDVYVASFTPDHRLLAATYIGGSTHELPDAVTRLPDGDILLFAFTSSPDLVAEATVSFGESGPGFSGDLFIARLDPDLTTFRWSVRFTSPPLFRVFSGFTIRDGELLISWYDTEGTYGGWFSRVGHFTVLDLSDGSLLNDVQRNRSQSRGILPLPDGGYVLLEDTFETPEVSPDAYQSVSHGSIETILTWTTSTLDPISSTFFGGSGRDIASSGVVLPDGSLVLCCQTTSDELPTIHADGNFDEHVPGERDLHLSRWAPDGHSLLWAGYLDRGDVEDFTDMEQDDSGDLLLLISSEQLRSLSPDRSSQTKTVDQRLNSVVRLTAGSGRKVWSTTLYPGAYSEVNDLSVSQGCFLLSGCFMGRTPLPIPQPTADAYDTTFAADEAFLILATDPDHVPLDPITPPRLLPDGLTLRVTSHQGQTIALRAGLPEPAHAAVQVHDLRGRCIASLHQGALPAGFTDLEWDGRTADGRKAPHGAYCVSLSAEGRRTSRTITLR